MSIETQETDTAEAVQTQDVAESTGDDQQQDTDEQGADALGDAGKQALDRMKAKVKSEREARLKAERERDEAKGVTEQERAAREAEAAALTKANERILRSEVRTAAKGVLQDPADAFRYLDLSDFEVDDDGNVDEDAIASAIGDLVKSKPYLAAQGGKPGTVFESPGAHRKGAPASQLTHADLQNMTPEQINAARVEGRLANLGFKK